MCQLVDWGRHDLDTQSCMMKEFQGDAALYARDALFNEDPQHHSAVLIRLSSIARCVWSRNLKLHFTLTRHSELARQHLVLENHVPRLAHLKLLRRL